ADSLDVAIVPSSVAWKARVAALHQSIFYEYGRYDDTANDPAFDAFLASEKTAQAGLRRDIIGPLPFREVHIVPRWLAWNDGTVRRLAAAIYEERALPSGTLDTVRLAVLADALEESGCTDAELLAHLRSPGPHVRGCLALDTVLGKS